LVVLGLLTAVLGSPVGRLFLVDDLQQALHSKTEAALIRVLRERFKADETLQMVVATHSSALIDGLEPDSVWHLSTNAQGVVTLA
jgi:predicted ATPase